ncbi:hypothetical protein [Ferrimonas lipolytica]|uniref:Uncharacterized protein n=1 Tax=Ferrimonas lipolytica TaxID=2724191 RepID=A0A6H1UEP6_9GAMM|nr:hypothetical protein [Ferrimonas lipolytica]QIZ76813.1 hypothetical protein HER31_07940 [Ferrimonas lipolytica]
MNERIGPKQIRCQFTLDVDENPAHDYALVVLKQWLAQQQHDPQAVSQFNRQIYLSGLFLHLLAPTLPAALANSFGPTSAGIDILCEHLNLVPLADTDASATAPLLTELALQQQAQCDQLASLRQAFDDFRKTDERPAPTLNDDLSAHLSAANKIVAGNEQLRNQLQQLQQQVAKLALPAATPASSAATNQIEAHTSDEQAAVAAAIAKVANVKAKGLW